MYGKFQTDNVCKFPVENMPKLHLTAGCWPNEKYEFSRHIANVIVSNCLFQENMRAVVENAENPEKIARILQLYFDIIERGKYRGADIWNFYVPFVGATYWYVTLCHRNLPEMKEGCALPHVRVTMRDIEIKEFQHRLLKML